METLEKLFEETLRDIYYAEKAILKNLPKMARKDTDAKLSELALSEINIEADEAAPKAGRKGKSGRREVAE